VADGLEIIQRSAVAGRLETIFFIPPKRILPRGSVLPELWGFFFATNKRFKAYPIFMSDEINKN